MLQRDFLNLWFLVAYFEIDAGATLESLRPGPVGLPPGADRRWTVRHVMVSAENALLDGADNATLIFWKGVIDFINHAEDPSLP